MKIFFPMGGRGKRFVDGGYPTPKPLLPFQGKTLLECAVASTTRLQGSYDYLPRNEWMEELTKLTLPGGCWHPIEKQTTGPLQTLWEAQECLATEEEVLIMDCDSVIDAGELQNAVEVFRATGANGGVPIRYTHDPACSYAEVDQEWWVTSTREGEAYTAWSTTGPYWFRTGHFFLMASQRAMAAHDTTVSPVYNYLGRVKAVPVSSFRHLGTPEAYERSKGAME